MIAQPQKNPTPKKRKVIKIVDLFCGAGGTTTGAVEAVRALGYDAEVTVVNHDPASIATHKLNHPEANHLCTGVDDVAPRSLFKRGELDILLASPECTNHSKAKGGKPRDDQSRASGWCILKWAEQVAPKIILIENVAEYLDWGPIGSNGKPLKSKKGSTFRAWSDTLKALGYKLEWKKQVSADFGDPTTRERLIIMCVLGKRKCVWPNRTHAPAKYIESRKTDLFPVAFKPWVPAADIIDWSIPGKSIFERDRPLSDKTLARIEAGLRKFGLKGFVLPREGFYRGNQARSVDEPLATVTASHGAGSLVQPFIVPQFGERPGQQPRVHDVTHPLPAVTSHGAGALVQPFIIPQNSSNAPRSVDRPAPVVTTTSRGIGLVESYIVAWDNQSAGSGGGITAISDPLSTVVTKARHGIAEPFLVELRGGTPGAFWRTARSLEHPLSTVTANGTHHGLCMPFLVNMKGNSDAADIDLPAPTITAHACHLYFAQPFLVKCANGISRAGEATRARSLDEPAPTITCSNDLALIEPFLIKTANGTDANASRVKSLDDTLPTICGNRGDFALVESSLLPQQSGGRLRPVSEPAPSVATSGAIALVQTDFEPFLVSYYGTGQALGVDEPLPTVTCTDRFGLVRPVVEIDGTKYLLDIRFRMLQPHELALAQGFRKSYLFAGNKTVTVKQIGNAVTRRLARAHVAAALSQDPDVSWLIDAEEASPNEAAA